MSTTAKDFARSMHGLPPKMQAAIAVRAAVRVLPALGRVNASSGTVQKAIALAFLCCRHAKLHMGLPSLARAAAYGNAAAAAAAAAYAADAANAAAFAAAYAAANAADAAAFAAAYSDDDAAYVAYAASAASAANAAYSDDDAIRAQLRGGIWRKPWGHGLAEGERFTGRGMSQIGG